MNVIAAGAATGSNPMVNCSTGAASVSTFASTRTRSCSGWYSVPHCPVCLLTMSFQPPGAGRVQSVYFPAGTVALIVLPWPPPQRPDGMDRDRLVEMFRACRRLMSPGGCSIVVLAGLPAGQTYIEHSGPLIPAARHAGLGWLQHVIAITAPIVGQRITWRATPADPATLRAATHIKIHIDLLVFAPRTGRHG